MALHRWLTAIPAAAPLALAACASTYDDDLVEERSRNAFRYAPASEQVDAAVSSSPPSMAALDDAVLEDYLALGLDRSADLRTAFELWRAQSERVQANSSLPDPRFTYSEFLEEVQTRTGPQQRRFGVSQAFPWPGQLEAQADVEERAAEAAWAAVEAARLRVATQIAVAFHEYAFLGEELRLTAEQLELLRGLEPIVQSRVRSGAGQEDLLRLQVEIGRLEDDLSSLERRRQVHSSRLVDAVNLRDFEQVLPIPALLQPGEGDERLVEGAYEVALEGSPRLRELELAAQASRRAVDVVEFRRKPSFGLGLDYFQTGGALNPATPGSGDDPISLTLSLSLPVWGGGYASAEREARHRALAADGRIESAQSRLFADVEQRSYEIEDALRRMRLYRESLTPRAAEALTLTLASYRTGGASVLDVIDSERALLEFELSFWRACRDFQLGRARLVELVGGEL